MAKKAATIGNIGTDHDGFTPSLITTGSADIIIDNKPAARVGDKLAPHTKLGCSPHERTITTGSSTVFFNGKPAAITGSEIDCGGVVIGDSSVIIDDQVPSVISSQISNLFFDRKITFSSTMGYLIEDGDGQVLSSGRSANTYTGLVKNSGLIKIFIGGENE